jgi:glycosyltransferase involved in cell wall biosynthesis
VPVANLPVWFQRKGVPFQPSNPVVLEARVVAGSGGGPDKTILNSPRFLPRYRTLCAYMHPPEDPGFEQIRRKALTWDAPLIAISDRGPWDWKVVSQCLDICRKEKVSIWHGHDYKSNALGLLLRSFWPMKLVTTVHGWVHHTRRTVLYYYVDRLCLPHYDQVICVSQDLYEAARSSGVSPSCCTLIENGIDTQEFCRRHNGADAKSRLGVASDRLVLGAVGRLSPEKGFDLLIQAVHRLLHMGHNIELWLLGDGPEKAKLAKLIGDLGLDDRIRLLGYVADVRERFEAMDVFVLSSLREGLPNVVLEAMAMDVPVLATRVAGVPRVIDDGVNGLLMESGSVDSITQALIRILGNAPLRERLGTAGRQTVTTRYSFAVRMQRISSLYDQLLQRSCN